MDAQTTAPVKWSTGRKWLFRFLAVYLFIYIFPFPLNALAEGLWQSIGSVFDPMMNWIAHHLLQMKQHVELDSQNGSGDTSYYYVQEFVFVKLTAIATIIWSVLDRKRNNYTRLLYWVKAMVRYYLAFFLISYGAAKFNGGQFPQPDLNRLMQPYGKSSPMGLAWTFLGFSSAFGIFMGLSECIGGILILFRRTTLFGACIATTVLMNVVMINFCFDVPVKLFSSNLLLMALFLLCTEGSRFLNVFILNKPTAPISLSPVFAGRKMRITRIVTKVIYLLLCAVILADTYFEEQEYRSDVKPALYGSYTVDTFMRNSEIIPPLTTDSTRWNKLIISYTGNAQMENMTGQTTYFSFNTDTAHKTSIIYPYKDSTSKYTLNYTKHDSTLFFYGRYKGDYIYVKLRQFNEKKFLLTNRGFHWINEYPFNR